MRFWTHLSAGFLVVIVLCKLNLIDINASQGQMIVLLIIAGALLPDIDSEKTRQGKLFLPLARFFRHRGFLHTPLCGLLLSLAIYFISNDELIGLAFFLGYSIHLLLDLMNPKGIKLLYPLSNLTVRGKIKSGSKTEYRILAVIVAFILLFLLF